MRFSKLGSFKVNNFKNNFTPLSSMCCSFTDSQFSIHPWWNGKLFASILSFFYFRIIHEGILNIFLFLFCFINYRHSFARYFGILYILFLSSFFLCISSKFLINPWLDFTRVEIRFNFHFGIYISWIFNCSRIKFTRHNVANYSKNSMKILWF